MLILSHLIINIDNSIMKINISFLLVGLTLTACSQTNSPWELVFEDNFNNGALDTNVWRRTYRGSADWQNTQSSDPRCIGFRVGCLLLRGIVNDNLETDTAHFLTGGVITEGLKPLPSPGRYEIRARLNAARGAWPALWLLPYDGKAHPWPYGGEIDIMEEVGVNPDYVSSSLHAKGHYHVENTQVTKEIKCPGAEGSFHTYGMEWTPEYFQFYVDGQKTLYYKNPGTGKRDWPYDANFYVIFNLAWGGDWGGSQGVDESALPITMEVDWVRVWQK